MVAPGGTAGAEALVYTMESKAWSRYKFPAEATDFCQVGDDLYYRDGDNVMKFNDQTPTDNGTPIQGIVQWPWLDFKTPGRTKSLTGIDVVCDGTPTLSIGYDETNIIAMDNVGALSPDTVPGQPVPLQYMAPSFSVQLTFSSEAWKVMEVQLYLQDQEPMS
jgi:hypothetical protein